MHPGFDNVGDGHRVLVGRTGVVDAPDGAAVEVDVEQVATWPVLQVDGIGGAGDEGADQSWCGIPVGSFGHDPDAVTGVVGEEQGVVVLGRAGDGKVSLIVRTSDDLTGQVPAGKVIKELAPIVGGKGGGKADMAEGGGAIPEKLGEALEASYGVIEKLLSVN